MKLVTEISDHARPEKHDIALKILNGDHEEGRVEIHTPDAAWLERLATSEHANRRRVELLAKGMDVCRTLSQRRLFRSRSTSGCPVDHGQQRMNSCPVAKDGRASSNGDRLRSNTPTIHEGMESDFTTAGGVKGNLHCPYARVVKNHNSDTLLGSERNLPTPPIEDGGGLDVDKDETDPISAEFHADKLSSPPASATASTSKCPIRYLQKHTPEEVAQYFEKHKHEIPRSHAVCVRRYQGNASSLRQLDNKYGNLVSMIQGLGQKHQAYLPKDVQQNHGERSSSSERVSKWAESVSNGMPSLDHETTDITSPTQESGFEEEREGRFERPLREVRVGESPSRPWGIPIPHNHKASNDMTLSPAAPVTPHLPKTLGLAVEAASTSTPIPQRSPLLHAQPAEAVKSGERPTGKCPFSTMQAGAMENPHTQTPPPPPLEAEKDETPRACPVRHKEIPRPEAPADPEKSPTPTQLVFNGPVFFGYSPEQTMAFLRQMGSQTTQP